ncbi:MAG: S53 family peptidase [Terriglobales bacterium]
MRTLRPASILAILLTLTLTSMCFAASPDRISSAVVAAQTVRLTHGVPMQARPKFDQGRVSPSFKLPYVTLLTAPSASQQKALTKLLADQQNKHSASYHKWLTPEQYADQFGLSSGDINKLTTWLKSQGFTVVRTARGRNWIVFSGTAAQVEKTFKTEIHNFKVDGEMHFANTTPPSIPAALSGLVTGFRGMSNFRPKSQARRAAPGYTFPYNGGSYLFLAPGDISTIYDVNALYAAGIDGTGQTLAVMGQTGIYQSDLTNFRQNFGLSAINCTTVVDIIQSCNTSNFQYVLVNGSPNNIFGDLPEADIDVEWSGATARNAQVIYVNSTDFSGGGVWDSWYYAVDNDVAPVITMSYTAPCELAEAGDTGTGEFTYTSDEAELAQANSEGITFLNSAGDSGVAECDYQTNNAVYGYAAAYPASSQYVTGVGGTLIPQSEFTATYWSTTNGSNGASALSYIPEQVWNDSLEFAVYCEANPTASFCTGNGLGGGPLLTDWMNAQENVIGISAGGGGISNCVAIDANGVCTAGFPQPTWQAGLDTSAINPSGNGAIGSTPTRYSPDVSLLASPNFPGYLICTQLSAFGAGSGSTCDSPTTGIADMLTACLNGTEPCSIFGGTSVSSPVFAGMVALLNQDVVTNGGQETPGLGNINPMLYSLAATPGNFNPITTSATDGVYSNGAWCSAGTPISGVTGDPWPASLQCPSTGSNLIEFRTDQFDATTNYNLAVGLGSPDLNNLAGALVASLGTNFTMAATGSTTQTVLAGQTTPVYSFTLTPSTGTFGQAVSFGCSFSPTDPTLTTSSCVFSPTSIAAGTTGAQTVTMSLVTVGPNPNAGDRKQQRRRADNRLPWMPLTLPLAGVIMVGFAGRRLSKYSMLASLCLALVLAGLLIACSSSNSTPALSVTGVTATPASVFPNDVADGWPSQTSSISVTIANDSQNQGVTWTAGLGTIVSTGANTATYTAPTIVAGLPASDTITATSVTDTTKSATGSIALTPATVPNTYTATVTATAGTSTQTQSVTLVVQ